MIICVFFHLSFQIVILLSYFDMQDVPNIIVVIEQETSIRTGKIN